MASLNQFSSCSDFFIVGPEAADTDNINLASGLLEVATYKENSTRLNAIWIDAGYPILPFYSLNFVTDLK